MRMLNKWLCGAMLLIATIIGGSCLTSCSAVDDNPTVKPEVTLDDHT